jgi:hypothetical protein
MWLIPAIPAIRRLRSTGLCLQASLGKKSLQDPNSMEKIQVWWCVPAIPVTVGSLKQEACGLGQPGVGGVRADLQNNQSKKG